MRKVSEKPRKRKKLPPKVLSEARALAGKWQLPIQTAVQIAQGHRDLSDVVQRQLLVERLAVLVQRGELREDLAPQVVAGRYTLEHALFHTRLRQRKRAPDYTRSFLDDLARDEAPVALALLGCRLEQGVVAASRPFDLTFVTRGGDELLVQKHDIKFFFDARLRKHLVKTVRWGRDSQQMPAGTLGKVGARTDIKARELLSALEGDRSVDWRTVEGDVLRGRVQWFGRYEAILRTTKGDVTVLRHAAVSLG